MKLTGFEQASLFLSATGIKREGERGSGERKQVNKGFMTTKNKALHQANKVFITTKNKTLHNILTGQRRLTPSLTPKQ